MVRAATNRVDDKVTKRQRVPIGVYRDQLHVDGKDPNFVYRWAFDNTEDGLRIQRLQQAGYDLVRSSEVNVGETQVYASSDLGSLVRVPNGQTGGYLYLMKISREWYDSDNKERQDAISATENDIFRERDEHTDGFYGSVKEE